MKAAFTIFSLLFTFMLNFCHSAVLQSANNSPWNSTQMQSISVGKSGIPLRQGAESPPFHKSDSLPSGVTNDWLNRLRDENGNRIMPEEYEPDFIQQNTFNPLGPTEGFGSHVSSAGDVNGDGFNDIIIGALHYKTDTGRAYIYFGGTYWDTEPDVIMKGEAFSEFGSSVSSGDFNGDGYSDVVVGAHRFNSNTGRAYIYFGGSSMDAVADIIFTGEGTNNFFGQHFSSTGDVNNDGYSDLIVGAYGNSSNRGRAYVYLGGNSMDNTADVIMDGEFNGENFGSSASSAGDVNGDGFDDVIVGAYWYNGGIGRAFIFYGGSPMNNSPDVIMNGEGGHFGVNVSKAGDVNGDGFGDVIVGAYRHNSSRGKVYVYFGGSPMNNGADVTMTGEEPNALFGMATSSAGDLNRDGYSDIIVGAAHDFSPADTGKVYVYFGGAAMNNIPDVTLSGESLADNFGASVAATGDFNGDGYTELLVGASEYNSQRGRVYFYEYNVTGNITSSPVRTLTGSNTFSYFGSSVSFAGDVNGDGFNDIIVGAGDARIKGKAYIYFGGLNWDTTADVVMTGELDSSEFGISVSSGDFNSDGFSDIVVGAGRYNSNTGRAYIFLGGSNMDNIPDLKMTGETTSNLFGASVSNAGDVNGDGYPDIIVGAEEYGSNRGRAYIYFGGAAIDTIADVILNGQTTTNYFGNSVSSAGDVNNDGFSDVIVGAMWYGSGTGRAYIYYGGATMDTDADVTLFGEGGYFGYKVSSAGDVNGDGFSDVIVSAYRFSSNRGKAYLYHGGINMNDTVDLTFIGDEPSAIFGSGLANLGDINRDGYSDIIIAAPHLFTPADTGEAYVYFGGLSMDDIPDITIHGESLADGFGGAVSTLGDINGDGYYEFIVRAQSYNSSTGRVYIYDYRNTGQAISDLTMTGEGTNYYFGCSVSSAGDVNGDGFDDVIVGAPQTSSSPGKAYIFFGGAILNNIPDLIMTGEATNNYFGGAVSSAGDVNNDGFDDVLVGALWHGGGTGRAYIYLGGASMNNVPDVIMTGQGGLFGCVVSTAGDVNNDGFSDVIVAADRYGSNNGRAYIYLGGTSMDTVADVIMTGAESNAYLGAAASTAGDVNRDGYSDIIVSAFYAALDTGKVFIYFGGATMDNIPDVVIHGKQTSDNFGHNVSSAGDVNGDGFSDVIVGANWSNNTIYGSKDGRAYIYYGGDPMNSTEDVILYGEQGSLFGMLSRSEAGDMNGDGYSDVIIGAQNLNSATGRAYIYFGGAQMNNLPDVIMNGEAIGNEFGYSVSSAGDFNGDGFSDVIVGAQKYSSNTGRAYIYLSSAIGSAANKEFRSKTSGNWNSPLTWEMSTDGGNNWVQATSYPTDQSDEITIQSPHTVTLTSNESASLITINNGATLNISSRTLKLSHAGIPLINNGSLITANSTIEYNGTVTQSLAQNVNYSSLIINNPSGVTVSENFSLAGLLSIINGDLNLNGKTVTLLETASLLETPGNTVTGESGSITTTRYINQPLSLDIAGLGAVITSYENLGLTTIKREHKVENVDTGNQSIKRNFIISPQNNTALNAQFIFKYDASEINSVNESTLGLFRSNNGGLDYLNEGGTVDTINNQIVLDFVQSFSKWTAARNDDTLNTGMGLTANLYAKGKLCMRWGSVDTIRVRINRSEMSGNDSVNINYVIKNRETFEIIFDTIVTITHFQQNDSLIHLVMPYIDSPGSHAVIVQAIPSALDPINGFDIRSYCFDVTCGEFSYIEPCDTLDGSTGFNGVQGRLVAAFRNLNSTDAFPIRAIAHSFKDPGSGNAPYMLAIYADDGSGKPGNALYISRELITPPGNGFVQNVTHELETAVNIPPLTRFYVGYIQTSNINIHVSHQYEVPVRSNTFYFTNAYTNNEWIDFSDSSKNLRPDISPRTSTGSTSLAGLPSLRLNALLEGLYKPLTNKMTPDTVKLEVRSHTFPFSIVDECTAVLDSTGTGIFNFSNVNTLSDYFLVIRHRNHIETWSRGGPERFYICENDYDFTNSKSKAHESNMIQVDTSPLRFAFYSGDVNQDGVVDGTDGGLIDNDAANFNIGYLATDLNGDGTIDGTDALFADNNAASFVTAVIP